MATTHVFPTYVELASGATALVDSSTGIVTQIVWDDEDGPQMCECEQDWNCSLHGGTSRPTWIETRYSEMDLDPRERSY